MKNKTSMIDHRTQNKIPDWLFQDMPEDDFLLGKSPKDLGDTWEEEE